MSTRPRMDHGKFEPGKGWYDSTVGGWRLNPSELAPMPEKPWEPTEWDRQQYTDQELRKTQPRPNPPLEQIRALRRRAKDDPEARDALGKVLTGKARMQLSEYEGGIKAHLDAGGELPDGIAPLEGGD